MAYETCSIPSYKDFDSTMTALLAVDQLSVTLPTPRGSARALRNVSFTLEPGQTMGLIGESGCGKSLCALSIMGLLPPSASMSGSIQFNGLELLGKSDDQLQKLRGAKIAMIFQEPMSALNPLHTIADQIAEPLRLHLQLDRTAARKRALELLDRVQMPRAQERLNAYPHQLSGGQRQRVMIAMALSCGPQLLIADEPTTALDVTLQKDILKLMTNLVRQDNMSLLLISHNLGLMRDQVANIMVMYGGSIVESAGTDELFECRAHPYTQGLFNSRPTLGMRRGTRLPTIAGRVPELFDLSTLKGCTFADRCNHVEPRCRSELPQLEAMPQKQHWVRCAKWQTL
jgi:peptide/nickel transport system ATP-binding protein